MLINFLIKYSVYILFPGMAFLLSLILTGICIKLLPKLGMLDKPRGKRRIHTKTVPVGGGLAIIIAFFTAWLFFLASKWGYFIGTLKLELFDKVVISSSAIILLGILDDKFELHSRIKFLGQVAVAVICWFWGIRLSMIFAIPLPDFLSFILTVFWIISFVNAFNLIDGMDGLAAGLATISAVCMSVIFAVGHFPNDTVVILCLAGACLGFLRYNFHPAKIFLGDTGSMFLGFAFAVIGIISSNKSAAATSILVPMLAAGVPIFDVVLAIWRRFMRKFLPYQYLEGQTRTRKISEGDREHLHHRLLKRTDNNQRKTAIRIYFLSAIFAIIAILNIMQNSTVRGLSLVLVLILAYSIVHRIANIELWNTGKAILHGINPPKKSILLSLLQPVIDIASITAVYLLCRFLFLHSAYNDMTPLLWYYCLFWTVVPIALVLNLTNTYKRSWIHGSYPDYIYLVKSLLTGFTIVIGIDILVIGIFNWRSYVAERLLFISLVTIVMLGGRLFLRYLKNYLINILHIRKERNIMLQKILLCGAGVDCRYYMHRQSMNFENNPHRIIGIIDNDPIFWGQFIYGQKVLGQLSDIADIYETNKFDKVAITEDILETEKNNIIRFCKKHHIELVEWKSEETSLS